jgi:4a-hydroxytetrahydrobiopterin dehydratase
MKVMTKFEIRRTWCLGFKKYLDAIELLKRVAKAAERLNRHPDVEPQYVNLALRLTTHDAGNKVTERQLRLAEEIQKAVEESKDNLAQCPQPRNPTPLSSAAAGSLHLTGRVRL